MNDAYNTLFPTLRKAINAAKRVYGAARYGDVASVHRGLVGQSCQRHAPCVGYAICTREMSQNHERMHSVARMLPQDECILVCATWRGCCP